MKFSFLHAAILVLVVTALLAGCSSTPPAPVTPAPTTAATPPPSTPDTSLQRFILPPEDMPFSVANSMSQVPDLQDPSLSMFGAIRGYTTFYINQTENSPTAVQLGQRIIEYSPGNATRAYAFYLMVGHNVTEYNITWLKNPGIGEESSAAIIDSTIPGQAKPEGRIVFRKSGYMESVVMIGPTLDMDALTRIARLAADRIP